MPKRFASSIAALKRLRAVSHAPLTACKAALDQSQGDEVLGSAPFITNLDHMFYSHPTAKDARPEASTEGWVSVLMAPTPPHPLSSERHGTIGIVVSPMHNVAAVAELSCASDFAARHPSFTSLSSSAAQIAIEVAGMELYGSSWGSVRSFNTEEVLDRRLDNTTTLRDAIAKLSLSLDETVVLKRVSVLYPPNGGFVSGYAHGWGERHAGRVVSLASIGVESQVFEQEPPQSWDLSIEKPVRGLAQQIVAMKPVYSRLKQVPTKLKPSSQPPPPASEVALEAQDCVVPMDIGSGTISAVLDELGDSLDITSRLRPGAFLRWEVGEL